MAILTGIKARNIIPRWRSFRKSNISNESESFSFKSKDKRIISLSYTEQLWSWKKLKTIYTASDLLGAADMSGHSEKFKDVAKFILNQENAPYYSKKLAKRVLKIEEPESTGFLDIIERRKNNISFLKKLLKENPRNSLYWLELAREYTILGIKGKKVDDAINYASYLSNDNRYILRSISRFFIHINKLDDAQSILSSSDSVKYDPWVLASEIASNSVINKPSKLIKVAKEIIKSGNFSNFELSELNSALAMTEYWSGNLRKSNKLFRKSIIKPTENSLAQFLWLLKIQNYEIEKLDSFPSYSYEADTYELVVSQEYEKAILKAEEWLSDQPFSKQPSLFGAYISSLICDFGKGEEFSRIGLGSNKKDNMLLNNLAFFLASQNKFIEAEEEFNKINFNDLDDNQKIVVTATEGLINYRKGLAEKGKELYLKAYNEAKKIDQNELSAKAMIYLSREESINNATNMEKYIKETNSLVEKVKSNKNDIKKLWDNVKRNFLKRKKE